jgi:hypothetical protein
MPVCAGYQSLYELADTCACSISHWEPTPAAADAAASSSPASAGRLEFDVQEAVVSWEWLRVSFYF